MQYKLKSNYKDAPDDPLYIYMIVITDKIDFFRGRLPDPMKFTTLFQARTVCKSIHKYYPMYFQENERLRIEI